MILLLSTSDTDLLSARASGAEYRWGNPSRLLAEDVPGLADGADLIVLRILGSKRSWEDGVDAVLAAGVPVVVLGGEQAPDAELMELSTVPANVAAQAHNYLAEGGPENLAQLHAFLSDTVLLTGHGFAAPLHTPTWGLLGRTPTIEVDGPTVAILYYRAQHLAGNTAYIDALCTAIEKAGGRALPIFCASLRTAEPELLNTLKSADAMVVTVLAAGGTKPAGASAGGDDEAKKLKIEAAMLRAALKKAERSAGDSPSEEQQAEIAKLREQVEAADARIPPSTTTKKPVDEKLKQAKLDLAMARAALKKTERALSENPDDADLQAQLASQQQTYQSAETALHEAENSSPIPPPQRQLVDKKPVDEQLRALKTTMATCKADFKRAERELKDAEQAGGDTVAAQQHLDTARAALDVAAKAFADYMASKETN